MDTYICELIDRKGYVSQCFYREGESADEVLEGLKLFEWPNAPKGAKWRIETDEELNQRIKEEKLYRS